METEKNGAEETERPLTRSDVCGLMREGIAPAMMEFRREIGHMLQREQTRAEEEKGGI